MDAIVSPLGRDAIGAPARRGGGVARTESSASHVAPRPGALRPRQCRHAPRHARRRRCSWWTHVAETYGCGRRLRAASAVVNGVPDGGVKRLVGRFRRCPRRAAGRPVAGRVFRDAPTHHEPGLGSRRSHAVLVRALGRAGGPACAHRASRLGAPCAGRRDGGRARPLPRLPMAAAAITFVSLLRGWCRHGWQMRELVECPRCLRGYAAHQDGTVVGPEPCSAGRTAVRA